jgi:hypothetical protein
MSIWSDCEEFDAVPFYGFPVRPQFENDIITFEFPKGYEPNGSQTQSVAEKLQKLFNGEIIEVTENVVRVKVGKNSLNYVLYKCYLENN